MSNNNYYKYLKYKQKYLKLKLLIKENTKDINNYNQATTHPASIILSI